MLLIFVSVFPVVFILIYIYYRDKYEKEPLGLLIKAFLGGVLSAIATLLVMGPASLFFPELEGVSSNSLLMAFAGAAIPEEIFKFLFLYLIIWKNSNFNEYYDGIVYAVFVSLGFACLENILYVQQHGVGVGIMRGIISVPSHALDGVIMGYYFSLARFLPKRRTEYLFKSLFFAILAHGIFDYLLFYSSGIADIDPAMAGLTTLVFIAFVAFLWWLGFRKIKQHVEASVFKV